MKKISLFVPLLGTLLLSAAPERTPTLSVMPPHPIPA